MDIPQQQLQCPICLQIAQDAVQTSCCGNLFCYYCATKSAQSSFGKCPLCKSPGSFLPSNYMRQKIGKMTVKCRIQGCKQKLIHKDRKKHQARCIYKSMLCNFCKKSISKKVLAEHMLLQHQQQVDQFLKKLTEIKQQVLQFTQNQYDPSASIKNQAGRIASQGSSSKYYCGCKLQSSDMSTICGPTRGQNCRSCMKIDLAVRGLVYGKHLVNDRGRAACIEQNKAYCGIRLAPIQSGLRCWKGGACDSCQRLRKVLNRYIYVQQMQQQFYNQIQLNSQE